MARTAAKDLPQMPEGTGMNTAAVAATLAQLPTDDPDGRPFQPSP